MYQNKNKKSIVTPTGSGNQKKKEGGGGKQCARWSPCASAHRHFYHLGYVWEARFALLSTFTFLLFFVFFFSRKVWLFNQFSATCGFRALFTNPQISFFNNFFIKNGSHGTIYTFKNYFVTLFFSFSVFSCIQTDPYSSDFPLSSFFPIFGIKRFGELSEKTPDPHPSFSPLLL